MDKLFRILCRRYYQFTQLHLRVGFSLLSQTSVFVICMGDSVKPRHARVPNNFPSIEVSLIKKSTS